jgi:hypothetical protein
VNIIGYEEQSSKAKLEHNSILAALRSAYIREVERKFGYDSFNDPDLLILTEIATVTEVDPDWDKWMFPLGKNRKGLEKPEFGDGYQIRSLRGMKNGKEYFPPLSIPFVAVTGGRLDAAANCEFSQVSPINLVSETVFLQVDDPEWQEFWRKHYAEPLGRAKAQILLRYGLQSFGGNSQNFLLEMENGVPNGRVVFRDMGDYALHDYVLWALFGPGKDGTPPMPYKGIALENQDALVANWRDNLASSLLKFECNDLHQYLGSAGISEFPTFTGYHRPADSGMHTFNPFCATCFKVGNPAFVGHISPLWAYAILVSPNRYTYFSTSRTKEQWGKIFKVQMDWGVANVRAWTKYLERALGRNFFIDWELLPISEFLSKANWKKSGDESSLAHRMFDPSAYLLPQHANIWDDMYEKMKTWEMYPGMQVENFLATAEGQKAIVAYKNRKWTPSAPKFKLKALDDSDRPMVRKTVMMKYNGPSVREWSELTDDEGIIEIFTGSASDYKVGAYADDGQTVVYLDVSEIGSRPGKKADFGYLKIEYI